MALGGHAAVGTRGNILQQAPCYPSVLICKVAPILQQGARPLCEAIPTGRPSLRHLCPPYLTIASTVPAAPQNRLGLGSSWSCHTAVPIKGLKLTLKCTV